MRTTIGQATLESRGLNFDEDFFWIAIAALFGFTVIYNIGFTLALGFLKRKFVFLVLSSHFLVFDSWRWEILGYLAFTLVTYAAPGWSCVIISREKLSKIQKEDSTGGKDMVNGSSHMNSNGKQPASNDSS